MTCYLDTSNKRLICFNQEATPDFWDNMWETNGLTREGILNVKDTYVTRITKKYLLPEDGVILEGGCGHSRHVAALVNRGYRCIGVDSASKTVQTINQITPELDVRLDDVRHLKFEDAYFAGYWSLGVIEHFWDGYDTIGQEMARVLKPGGYLFLTFPYMSLVRKLKAKTGLYQHWEETTRAPASFYQFVLDRESVAHKFENWGLELVHSKPLFGLKGAKDEIGFLKWFLKPLYNYQGPSFIVRGFRFVLSALLTFFTGHVMLLVFQRKADAAQ